MRHQTHSLVAGSPSYAAAVGTGGNMGRRHTLRIALAMVGILLGFAPALGECPAKPYASLPLTRTPSRHFAVAVRIGGRPFNLLIDTGSPLSFITDSTADAAGLKRRSVARNLLTTANGTTSHTMATGDLIIANFKADAMDFPVVPKLGEAEDGLLGADILGRFGVEFDFARALLSLYPPSHCGSVPWAHTGEPKSVNFHFETGHIVFDVDLDGKTYNAHLDTGAPRAYIELETAISRFGFDENNPNQLTRRDGTHPEHPSYSHVFDKLTAGSLTIEKAELLLVSNKIATVHMQPPWLSFGLSLFKNYHLFIAYDEKELYFTEASAAP